MSFSFSSSILQASSFLTRPLSLVQDAHTFCVLQSKLRSNLHAAFASAPQKRLIMTFTADMPARPVLAACLETGIHWHQWMDCFGQQEFDLIIEESSVVARYHNSDSAIALPAHAVTIWSTPRLTAARRDLLAKLTPASTPLVPMRTPGRKNASRTAPGMAPPQHDTISPTTLNLEPVRTFAQHLIGSGDDSDAEELFAMISKSAIISPTPEKAHFPRNLSAILSPLSSPEPSDNSESRPSSRTSTFSSCFSDGGSLASVSTAPSTSGSFECIDPEALSESTVFVDSNKTDKTKYLYRGGLSSTLTGGVMLGCPSKTAAAISSSRHHIKPQMQQEKYRGPLADGRGAGQTCGASYGRAPAATAVGTASFRRF